MKVNLLGLNLDDLTQAQILALVEERVKNREKLWVVTPNPEFVVAASRDSSFCQRLNEADIAVIDGFGLILAAKVLGLKLNNRRVTGADLVGEILKLAQTKKWRLGIVGARRGEASEAAELVRRLRANYPGLEISSLPTKANSSGQWEIVFACQGMKAQEAWIKENLNKVEASVFMGVGGALDFYGGFAKRAPGLIRNLGLEWLWRLILRPQKHLKRIYTAVIVFGFLVIRERLRRTSLFSFLRP